MRIEIRVARCRSTSKNKCPDWISDMLKRLFIIERCPEFDTGKNSVMPCTRPRITAFQTLICINPHGNRKIYHNTFILQKQVIQNCRGRAFL